MAPATFEKFAICALLGVAAWGAASGDIYEERHLSSGNPNNIIVAAAASQYGDSSGPLQWKSTAMSVESYSVVTADASQYGDSCGPMQLKSSALGADSVAAGPTPDTSMRGGS